MYIFVSMYRGWYVFEQLPQRKLIWNVIKIKAELMFLFAVCEHIFIYILTDMYSYILVLNILALENVLD